MGIRNWLQLKGRQEQVKITGKRVKGEALTVSADPGFTVTAIQWMRNDVAIEGATETTYLLTAADVGTIIYPLLTGYKSENITVIDSESSIPDPVGFTIGTLCFGMASLDKYLYDTSTKRSWTEHMFSAAGEDVSLAIDAVSGRAIGDWYTKTLPVILARAGTENLVVVLANPLGNDITNAFGTYGRADAAPASYWTTRIELIADGVAQLQAAGFKVIVGNNSYRNYGLNDSCRADENIGSRFVDETYLHPWIKENMPECWDASIDRPILDVYNYVWGLGNWFFDDSDYTHPNNVGIAALRRFNFERIYAMSKGQIPDPVVKRTWPELGVSTTDVSETLFGFGSLTTLGNMPANINRVVAPTTTGNIILTYPDLIVDTAGNQSPIKVNAIAWNSFFTTGRGNTGDTSVSLTNHDLLKGNIYLGAGTAWIEINGLTPYGKYKVCVAGSAVVGSGAKIGNYGANTYPLLDVIDAEYVLPADFLVLEAIADPIGYIYLTVTTQSTSTSSYVSGISVESMA